MICASKRRSWRAVILPLLGLASVIALGGCTGTGTAPNPPYPFAYNSIPNVVLNNIPRLGLQSNHSNEYGDGLNLTHTGALYSVSVVLNDWACQTGGGTTCASAAGSTFAEPVTVNVYSVTATGTRVGSLIATKTVTFNIPFRPSQDPVKCTGASAGQFYSTPDQACSNGLSYVAFFDFTTGPAINVPAQIIVSVTYNTSTFGYAPYGNGAACFSGPNGCAYDSLNVSASGNGGPVGSVIDADGEFLYAQAGFYCNNTLPANEFRYDPSSPPDCWTGYHPQIAVRLR